MLRSGLGGWVLVVLLASGAFFVGRSSGEGRPVEAVERSVFRGALLTNPYSEPRGVENGDPWLVKARRSASESIADRQRVDPTLRVSLYARDLDNGSWVGIRDRALFYPSSLTKVAVLIRTLVREEEAPGTLDRQLLFEARRLELSVGECAVSHYPRQTGRQSGASLRVIATAFAELLTCVPPAKRLRRPGASPSEGQSAS